MTTIITQITENNIRRTQNTLEVEVKPFEYNGKRITYLEIERGNEDDWRGVVLDQNQPTKHGWVEIDLTNDKILGVEGNNTLKINGENITVNKWEPRDFVFIFEPTQASEWDQLGLATTISLSIKERKLVSEADFVPKINKIRVDKEKNENYFNNFFKRNTEYQLKLNLSNRPVGSMKLTGELEDKKTLDLSSWGKGLIIEEIGANNQPINQNQVKSKVQEAYNQAQTAYNNRRTNLEGAIQALKNLLKIGKEGTTEEKNEFAKIIAEYELDSMKSELRHNCYEQGKSIPNWEGENDTPPPPKEGDDTPTLWEQETAQPGFIERYNELYRGGKHSVLVKFSELHSQIHNNFEKYKDKPLFKQMDEKEATFREFRSIWDKDDKTKRLAVKNFNEAELAKREEVIKLMEQLLAENQGDSSDNSKKRKNDDQTDSSNKKPKTVAEIREEAQNEVATQDKVTQNTLTDLITEAQSKNTYAELEPLLKEIDKYKGEKSYSEKDSEITELKKRLIKLDSKSYRVSVSFNVKDKLEKNGIALSDLDSETQSLITKLENENISEEEVIKAEKQADEAIGFKVALNRLEKIIQKLRTIINERREKEAELKELVRFTESTNIYYQKAYQQKKSVVDSLLKGESSQGSPSKDNDFSWTPVLAIGGVFIIGIVGVLVFRSRKRKKEKEEVL